MYRMGILGCADIAFRRFLPAIQRVEGIQAVAVAEEYAPQKADAFCDSYSLQKEDSFESILMRKDINCVYIPQPPALHYIWAKRALELGKHVLVEKPSTTHYADSSELVAIAEQNHLALHENYMFQYHNQIQWIQNAIQQGNIGKLRMIRADFGFPRREKNDFRYNKELGGGALLDAGGYTLKLAAIFLGDTAKVDTAAKVMDDVTDVDIAGSATLSNDEGIVCQVAYGMDNAYRCHVEAWGSTGYLQTGRIFTAPPDLRPVIRIDSSQGAKEIVLESDMQFEHSIEVFCREMSDEKARESMYKQILLQAKLLDSVNNLTV